jgi:hypothetical protein
MDKLFTRVSERATGAFLVEWQWLPHGAAQPTVGSLSFEVDAYHKDDRGALAELKCRIPDDCIDSKRYPLFMARAVLKELIESLQSTQGVKPC